MCGVLAVGVADLSSAVGVLHSHDCICGLACRSFMASKNKGPLHAQLTAAWLVHPLLVVHMNAVNKNELDYDAMQVHISGMSHILSSGTLTFLRH
jgi:hypothetical protein